MSTEVTVEELDALIKTLKDLRSEKEDKELSLKETNKKIMELEAKCTKFLNDLKRDSYSSPEGTISIRRSFRVAVPSSLEEKTAFFSYLNEKGIFFDLVTVNSQTLNSFYRKELENAEDPMSFSIPGIGQSKLYESVNFRRK